MNETRPGRAPNLAYLHQFILESFDREELRTLCYDLDIDYDSLPAEGKAGKARELILALGRRRRLEPLLTALRRVRPTAFTQAGLNADQRAATALQSQLRAFEQTSTANRWVQRPTSIDQMASAYVEPGRSQRRRHIIAIIVIVAVVGSLILTLLTQPWSSLQGDEGTLPLGSPQEDRDAQPLGPPYGGQGALPLGSLLCIGQIIVSFVAILASIMQLIGVDMRALFSTRSAGASVEAFPFHVIRDFDELLNHLFPDPTAPLLADRDIPFLPRIADELDTAFSRRSHAGRGRILIQGSSKTGKTREAVELLQRWWYNGPTVLLAKNHVSLRPPYSIPAHLPVNNLVLLFDDVDRYCGSVEAIRIDPEHANAYNSRGWAYYHLDDYEQTIAEFTEAIRIDPEFATAYRGRGWAYHDLDDYQQAIADFTEAIRIDPEYALTHKNRGWVYYYLDDYEQAIADWGRAVELYEAQGEIEEAESLRVWIAALEERE